MPGGRVYAFEMDRVNYDLLSRNVEVNEFANVEAYHAAVTESPGNVSFARPTRLPNATLTLAPQENAVKNMVSVEAVSLDAFFSGRDHPDMVKIEQDHACVEHRPLAPEASL